MLVVLVAWMLLVLPVLRERRVLQVPPLVLWLPRVAVFVPQPGAR